MTKKQAINILKTQKEKLGLPGVLSNQLWLTTTKSHISAIFGTPSSELHFISTFREYPEEVYFLKKNTREIVAENTELLKSFLAECIDTLEKRGMPNRKNLFERFNTGNIVTVGVFIAGAIGTGCYVMGNYTADLKNIKIQEEKDKISDSLNIFKADNLKIKDSLKECKKRDLRGIK